MPSVAQNRKRKKAALAYAKAHGLKVPKGYAWQPGRIGKPARELVREIELHVWPKQAPTGTFNTRVLAVLFPPIAIGLKATNIAGKELGVKEDPAGSNSGPRVRQYQSTTNPGQTGFPWCASFVTWCLREADWKTTFPDQSFVPSWVAAAHSGKYPLMVVSKAQTIPGDLVTYDWNNDRIADHIGFVLTKPDAAGAFKAREGNTAIGNDSNGGEVMDRDRNVVDVCCFIRITK